jgi:hypothetical protein
MSEFYPNWEDVEEEKTIWLMTHRCSLYYSSAAIDEYLRRYPQTLFFKITKPDLTLLPTNLSEDIPGISRACFPLSKQKKFTFKVIPYLSMFEAFGEIRKDITYYTRGEGQDAVSKENRGVYFLDSTSDEVTSCLAWLMSVR